MRISSFFIISFEIPKLIPISEKKKKPKAEKEESYHFTMIVME